LTADGLNGHAEACSIEQEDRMSKSMVTKIFIGSLVAVIGGLVVLAAGIVLAFANSAFIMSGPDVTGIEATPFAWSMVGVAVLGLLAMVGGALGQFFAWIGAVLNTAHLDDKTWFLLLLVLGLLSFGFIAMVVYVLAGPDGTAVHPPVRSAPATQPSVG
jgi:hypothetical protein